MDVISRHYTCVLTPGDIDSPMAGLEWTSSVGALRACDGEGCEEEQCSGAEALRRLWSTFVD